MKTTAATLVAVTIFCAQLVFARSAAAEVIQSKETAAPEQILTSASSAHRLVLLSFSPVVVQGKTLGAVLVYDDPKTARSDDYVELYDNGANLVAVGWYDHFGIQRIAVDRGLFDEGYALTGVFVTLLSGDSI
ncbi:MAG TPA: hypothetical protein VIB79_08640 [Candidatus Binatia bacterium]|jgi:hypothetical protein